MNFCIGTGMTTTEHHNKQAGHYISLLASIFKIISLMLASIAQSYSMMM
jgi:hypothetical protein